MVWSTTATILEWISDTFLKEERWPKWDDMGVHDLERLKRFKICNGNINSHNFSGIRKQYFSCNAENNDRTGFFKQNGAQYYLETDTMNLIFDRNVILLSYQLILLKETIYLSAEWTSAEVYKNYKQIEIKEYLKNAINTV